MASRVAEDHRFYVPLLGCNYNQMQSIAAAENTLYLDISCILIKSQVPELLCLCV